MCLPVELRENAKAIRPLSSNKKNIRSRTTKSKMTASLSLASCTQGACLPHRSRQQFLDHEDDAPSTAPKS